MTKHFKRPLSVLLAVLMIVGIFVTVPMTASAWDDNPYAELVNTTTTVKFNGLDWYVIKDNSTAVDAGTVTLLAKDPICASQFDDSSSAYSTSTVKTYLDGLTTGTGSFADVANAIKTVQVKGSDSDSAVDAKLYLLSVDEANAISNAKILKCTQATGASLNRWWLRTPGIQNGTPRDNGVAYVTGDSNSIKDGGAFVTSMYGVRPALQLDLSAVNFSAVRLSGGTNTTVSGGSISQNYFEVGNTQNAMTTVTYTAKTDCVFPATSEYYTTTNGITVTRTSDTVVTVSGTPNGVANIVVPNAKKPQVITASDVTVTYGEVGKCVIGTTNGEGGITYTVKSGDAVTVNETSGELTTRNVGTAVITITAAETSACLKATKDVTVTVTAEQTQPDPSSGAYADLVNTTTSVKFNGIAWYIIKDDSTAVDAGTVTLLAKDPIGVSKFNENQSDGNAYSGSTVEAYLNSLTSAGGSFEAVKDAIIDSKINLLSLEEANTLKDVNIYLLECISPAGTTSNLNYYWLSDPGSDGSNKAAYVGGDHGAIKAGGSYVDRVYGVRPVLQLDLSKVTFSSASVNMTGGANATTSGGSVSQKFFEPDSSTHSAIIPVTYTAGVCCTFPETSEYYTTTNGITVAKIDEKTVTVSGTPTDDDVNIIIPNAIPDHDLHCYATGATITAYCPTAKCPMRENKTPAMMTIVKPTTSAEATLTDLDAFNIATGLSVSTNDIKYYKATKNGDEYTKGEALTVAPTAAGDYVAEIKVSGVKNRDDEPNQSVTASVGYTIESGPYESLVCNDKATVMFNGMAWYVIEDNSTAENAGTLTLLARDPLCASVFNNGDRYTNNIDQYSNSVVRTYLDGLTTGSGSFAGVADAIMPVDLPDVNVTGAKLYLLSEDEVQTIFSTNKFILTCTKANGVTNGLNYCWTRTAVVGTADDADHQIHSNHVGYWDGDNGKYKSKGMYVFRSGNVRPALKLDLSKVTLSPVTVNLSGGANATTTGGGRIQRFFELDSSTHSPIVTVYYNGGTCCTFPSTSEYYTTTDGITVEYIDSKTLKVSGTPTKDYVNITIPDAIANHNFTYSASGATITAGCNTSGCPARSSFDPVKLTIATPTGDGSSTEATLTNLDAFNSATNLSISTNDIKYYNATKSGDTYTKNGDALTGAPSSAGDYLAEITVSGATASVGYTIDIPEGINYSGDNYIKQDDKVQVSDSDEGKTKFGLNLGEYFNMQMLGIQKKSAIATQGGDDGIRFVTAVNTNLLKGEKIEDYGYIVVKAKDGTSVDKIYENMDKLTYDKVGANNRFTCKGTSNTISGDFGKYDTNTDYKYVTLSLTNTSGSTDTIAARFYIKTTDGNYYYADYIDGNNVTHRGMAFTLPIA